jgi:phospholipase C
VAVEDMANGDIMLKLRDDSRDGRGTFLRISSRYSAFGTSNGVPYSIDVKVVLPGQEREIQIDTRDGWYDVSVQILGPDGNPYGNYLRRFAGHVETGRSSKTDPFLTDNLMV